MSRRQIARDAIDQIRFRLRGASDAAVNVLLDRVLEGIKGQRVVDLARMTPDVLAGILPRVYPQMLGGRARAPGRRPALLHRHRGLAAGGRDAGRRRSPWTARSGRAGRSTTASTPAASTARSPTARARREALREFAARAGHRPGAVVGLLRRGLGPADARGGRPPRRRQPGRRRWRRSHAARAGRCCASRSSGERLRVGAARRWSPPRSAAAAAGSPRAGARGSAPRVASGRPRRA